MRLDGRLALCHNGNVSEAVVAYWKAGSHKGYLSEEGVKDSIEKATVFPDYDTAFAYIADQGGVNFACQFEYRYEAGARALEEQEQAREREEMV